MAFTVDPEKFRFPAEFAAAVKGKRVLISGAGKDQGLGQSFALAADTEKYVPLTSMWNGNSPATVYGYSFGNYGGRSYGPVSRLTATENCITSSYVELESDIGVTSVADAAVRAGIPSDTPGMDLDNLDLTFVLGTASPSGLDLANAYATFAANGRRSTTSVIREVIGPNGGLLFQLDARPASAFDPDVASTVTYALARVVTDGTAFVGAWSDPDGQLWASSGRGSGVRTWKLAPTIEHTWVAAPEQGVLVRAYADGLSLAMTGDASGATLGTWRSETSPAVQVAPTVPGTAAEGLVIAVRSTG